MVEIKTLTLRPGDLPGLLVVLEECEKARGRFMLTGRKFDGSDRRGADRTPAKLTRLEGRSAAVATVERLPRR